MSFISTAGDLGIQHRVPTSAYYGNPYYNSNSGIGNQDPKSPISGITGPTGATGAVFLTTATLELKTAPIEGSSLKAVIGKNLAYTSGNTIIFYNGTGSFEGFVASYYPLSGEVAVARITNVLGKVTGTQAFIVNLGGARGATIFSGPAPPGPSGRIGDYYLDTQAFVLYKLILP